MCHIITSRLEIHPMRMEEWPDILEIFSDFESSPESIYDYPLPTTESEVRKRVEVWSESGYFYSVCLKGSSEAIGYLCFCGKQVREMGYSFKKKVRGKGYALEAAKEMLDQMKKMGVTLFRAEIAEENLPSVNLVQKLGFYQTGTKYHLFRKETGKEEKCGVFEKEVK